MILTYIGHELNLYAHIVGFPDSTNSKSATDDRKNKKQNTEIGISTSTYKPLYKLSNSYLKKGYNVLYLAESFQCGQTDREKVVQNITDANFNNKKYVQNK